MTEKEFKEAMHTIAGREDSGQYYSYAENKAKKRKALRTGIICGSIAAVAIIVVALGIVLGSRNAVKTPKTPGIDNGAVLTNPTEQAGSVTVPAAQKDPAADPTKEPTKQPEPAKEPTREPTQEPTKLPDPTQEPTREPTAIPTEPVQETTDGDIEPYVAPAWFSKGTLKLMPLSYSDLNQNR